MGPNETQNVCAAKETINKTKRQPSEWEKPFTKESMDKEPPKYINTSCISVSKKQTTQSKKWAEDLNRHFSKEDIQMPTNT